MMTLVDDRALLAQVADGDRDALAELYSRHAGWLTARLQSRCGDPDIADLAVQDTFLAAWKSAKKFRGEGDVGAWLWGIGIRRLIDQLRRRRTVPLDPTVLETDARLFGSAPAADELAIGVSDGNLGAALAALPGELRAVLMATAIDGLTTREAARLLGVPQGTVKTRLMRARQQMQEALS